MKKNALLLISAGVVFLLAACKTQKDTGATVPVRSASSYFAQNDSSEIQRNFIDGCKFLALDDYQSAIASFKSVLKLDPDNAPSYYQLAKIYFESGQINDALNYAKHSTDITPSNIFYQLLYAELLSYSNAYADAATVYRKIISLDPMHEDAYYQLAFLLEKQKKYEEALEVLNDIISKEGADEKNLMEVERIYIQLNDPEKAIATLKQLHDLNPEAPQYLYMLSEAYELTGQSAEAEKIFNELIQMDPNNPDLQFRRAALLRKTGDINGYYEVMRAAFSNPGGNIDKKIFFLVPYVDSIDNKKFSMKDTVLAWTKILTDIYPEDAKGYALRGDFLFYDKQLSEARINYKKSTAIRADVYDVWIKLFYIDSDLRMYDSLKLTTETAMELYPNQPLGYYFNGVALKNLREYNDAVKVLKRGLPIAVSNNKLRADIYTALGDCYNELGNYPESDAAFDISLSLNPENAFALNNYAYYLSLRKENLDKAEEMSKRSIEIAPDEPSLEDTYAWILFQNGKYSDARKWLEKALEHGGDDSGVILEHYGDVLFQLGDESRALEYWKKAKAVGGASDLIDKKISTGRYE